MLKNIISFLIVFILIIGFCINTCAIDTGMEVKDVTVSQQEQVLASINFNKITYPNNKLPISCFNVNENGMIALGLEDRSNKYIYIYSEHEEFLCGYRFILDGAFFVDWNGDNIVVYIVRGDYLVTFNLDGEFLEMKKATNSIHNNSYMNNVLNLNPKKQNENLYKAKNDFGIFNLIMPNYSKFIIEKDGVQNVIYDTGTTYFRKVILKLVFEILLFLVVIIGITRPLWKPYLDKKSKIKNNTI